jgi:hypothetical protein
MLVLRLLCATLPALAERGDSNEASNGAAGGMEAQGDGGALQDWDEKPASPQYQAAGGGLEAKIE